MSSEFNRLLTAALANENFRKLLLADPQKALEKGYGDEQFNLTQKEKDFLFSIHAATLQELANQLSKFD
jgi:hypothetical protein